MKITSELKLIMQVNSFIGMIAAAFLIKMGLHTTIAYAGFTINALCLVHWIFIKEDNENTKDY